ncbi:hypothetical protein D2E22_1215 [Bifidobacterium castoris]|uniref:Uncharacterized protein n=1 Tax=Bifidobacterium castoris TaxID=2306972 RepID=A0A430F6V8_9BIFI|nr:hypothetical protein D2E22_1215 [Bifidobacterium castoris]
MVGRNKRWLIGEFKCLIDHTPFRTLAQMHTRTTGGIVTFQFGKTAVEFLAPRKNIVHFSSSLGGFRRQCHCCSITFTEVCIDLFIDEWIDGFEILLFDGDFIRQTFQEITVVTQTRFAV